MVKAKGNNSNNATAVFLSRDCVENAKARDKTDDMMHGTRQTALVVMGIKHGEKSSEVKRSHLQQVAGRQFSEATTKDLIEKMVSLEQLKESYNLDRGVTGSRGDVIALFCEYIQLVCLRCDACNSIGNL